MVSEGWQDLLICNLNQRRRFGTRVNAARCINPV